jgi:hypothetical protein
MSVTAEILTGGKPVPALKELLPEGLEYGVYGENYVLREADGEDSVMVFDPACICRGICLETSEDSVTLGLSNVTGASEIHLFYDLVRRVCEIFGTKVFKREDAIVSLEQAARFEEEDLSSAAAGLDVMLAKLKAGEDNVTMFGALNPITLDESDLKKIGADPEKLGTFLHEKQSANAYFAAPRVFQDPKDGSLVGVYSVPCGTRTIMPYAPAAPFYLQQKVDRWIVYVYISDEKYGYVDFADFAAGVSGLGPYDAAHYLLELDEAAAEKLIKEHPARM